MVMLKQEEEVHGKQRELDRLKDEEKELTTDIKKSEREIQRIEDDLKVVQELEEEVSFILLCLSTSTCVSTMYARDSLAVCNFAMSQRKKLL